MDVTFVESKAINGVYHALIGDEGVGMIQRVGERWRSVVYRRDGNDFEATLADKHAAMTFLEDNLPYRGARVS